MGTTAEKGAYLNQTKSLLKDKINALGGSIDDETTFREYVNQLDGIYEALPKTEFEEGESVTLENTLKGKLDFQDNIAGIGQAKQETTQGYNLLNLLASYIKTINSTSGGVWNENKYTLNGITFELETNSRGVITQIKMNGTSTAQTIFYLYNNANNLPSGDYLLSGCFNGSNSTYDLRAYNFNGGNEVKQNYTTPTSVTSNGGTQGVNIAILVRNNQTITNAIIKPMIESGTVAHSWEPYTGGYASPSPNWRQQIQRVAGKNKFDLGTSLDDYFQTNTNGTKPGSWTVNAVTATIEENKLTIDTYNSSGWNWLSKWVELEPNTDYTISGTNTSVLKIVGFNSNELQTQGTQIIQKTANASDSVKTFNSGDYKYYCLSCFPEATGKYFENIQIEEGTQATSYLPFNTLEEVVSGKNKADLGTFDKEAFGVRSTCQNQKIKYNGTTTSGGNLLPNDFNSYSLGIFKKGTYTASFHYIGGTYTEPSGVGNAFYFRVPSLGIVINTGAGFIVSGWSRTFTLTEDAEVFIQHYVNGAGMVLDNFEYGIQIEENSTATLFEPYITSETYQFSLGDHKFYGIPNTNYRDTIRRSSGKNLFDKNAVTNGYYVNSATGELATASSAFNASDWIEVNTGDYVWGATSTHGYSLVVYDNNKNYIRRVPREATQPIQVTIAENEKYVRYTVSTADLDTQQFERGSTATDYEPYGVGVWYKYGVIGEEIVDGNTSGNNCYFDYTAGNGWGNVYKNGAELKTALPTSSVDEVGKVMSNYLKAISTNATVGGNVGVSVTQNGAIGTNLGSNYTTKSAKNTFAQSNNILLCFALANPKIDIITGTLAEQLEAFWNAQSVEGTTIIEGDGDLPMLINVRALKGA